MGKRAKTFIIILIFSVLCVNTDARNGKDGPVSWGVEWSYSAVFLTASHYNFYAPEGFRVDINDMAFRYVTNGEVLANISYNINDFWRIGLYTGFAGAADLHHIMPVSLRITHSFKPDTMGDRWFSFMDLGSGLGLKRHIQHIITAKIGGGYRISLSERTKLDFIASVNAIKTHPEIVYYGESIDYNRINRNNSYINSISIGVALNF